MYSDSLCDALKEGMEINKRLYEQNKRDAEMREREVIPFIIKNNEIAKQVEKEIALLGINTLLRSRAVKFFSGAVRFLEEVDAIDTRTENSSQIRALMNRWKAAHDDAKDAIDVAEESAKAAEREKMNYEAKEKEFERGCRRK